MKKHALWIVFTAATFCAADSAHAVVLSVSDTITVMSNGEVVPLDGSGNIDTSGFTAPAGPIGPTSGESWQYGIRERGAPQQGQTDRRAYSFLHFDTSVLTLAEVQDPNFSATFGVDYKGHLNSLNNGLDVQLGQVTSGAWDSTTSLPNDTFSTDSTALGILVTNAASQPDPLPGITLDITSVVTGWVDGSIANQGLTFTSSALVAQAAYFSNATIVTAVPEPSSSVSLIGLAIWGLALQRKRRR